MTTSPTSITRSTGDGESGPLINTRMVDMPVSTQKLSTIWVFHHTSLDSWVHEWESNTAYYTIYSTVFSLAK